MGFLPKSVKDLDAAADRMSHIGTEFKEVMKALDRMTEAVNATRPSIDALAEGLKCGRQLAGSIDRAVDTVNRLEPKITELTQKADRMMTMLEAFQKK